MGVFRDLPQIRPERDRFVVPHDFDRTPDIKRSWENYLMNDDIVGILRKLYKQKIDKTFFTSADANMDSIFNPPYCEFAVQELGFDNTQFEEMFASDMSDGEADADAQDEDYVASDVERVTTPDIPNLQQDSCSNDGGEEGSACGTGESVPDNEKQRSNNTSSEVDEEQEKEPVEVAEM